MFDDVRWDLVSDRRWERPPVAGGCRALRIGCGLAFPLLLLFLWLALHERTSPPPTPAVELGADRPALLWQRLGTPYRAARAPAAFAPSSERRPPTKLIADLRGLVVAADLPRGLEFPEPDDTPAASAPSAAGGPATGLGAVVPPAARPPLLALLAGVVWAVVRGLAAVPGRLLRACEQLLRTPSKPVRRVAAPPLEERFAILQQLLAYQQAGVPDRDVQQLAAATSGLSRSQLNQLVTRAAKAAFGQGRSTISSDDLRLALRTAPAEDTSTAYSFASMATAPQGSAKPSTPPWQRSSKAPAKDLLLDRSRARNLFAETLRRVALPALLATVTGYLYFDNLSLFLQSSLDPDALRVLGRDESQFMQNFQTVIGLLFSILAGNAYSSLYAQQENIYFALFQEVSEAKSLLEQVTLVCQGRPMYGKTLRYIKSYVENDLRKLEAPPAELLSGKPSDDPLESIMYLTSVGVPSVVYETVKSLRQARAYRLGAMQRKFPFLGIVLLYVLAILVVIPFPLLSAGALPKTATNILWIQSSLFGFLAGSIVLCLRIIQELWQSSGGVFNVDEVLLKMVSGLQEELDVRSSGLIVVDAGPDRPALPRRVSLDLSTYPPTWPKAAAEDGRPPPPPRPDGPGLS